MATSGVSQQILFALAWPCQSLDRIASWDGSSTAMISPFGFCSQSSMLISDLGEVGREKEWEGVEIWAHVACGRNHRATAV